MCRQLALVTTFGILMGMFTLAFNIQSVKAFGTVYIRADGSVDPDTAPIFTVDDITYTFTDNITDSIVVERDNIVINGAGYTLQGTGSRAGLDLSRRSDVTIKSMKITTFSSGIWVEHSHNIRVSGNSITNNDRDGIHILSSSNCSIFGNNITNNNERGIWFWPSSNNRIFENNIINSKYGVFFQLSCKNNTIYENNITNNKYGILLTGVLIVGYKECPENNKIYGNNISNNTNAGVHLNGSSNNIFYHNNFVNNTLQIEVTQMERKQTNIWDNDYPSGGNYWSDYAGMDENSDGIGDAPYVVDESNQDNHPLMSPWSPTWSSPSVEEVPFWIQWWFYAIVAIVIVSLAGAAYFLKKREPPTPPAPSLPTEGSTAYS